MRTLPTTTAALAVLATTTEPDGSPLGPGTREAIARAIASARADVETVVRAEGVAHTARALGVSRSTLQRWRAAGWLAPGSAAR